MRMLNMTQVSVTLPVETWLVILNNLPETLATDLPSLVSKSNLVTGIIAQVNRDCEHIIQGKD